MKVDGEAKNSLLLIANDVTHIKRRIELLHNIDDATENR